VGWIQAAMAAFQLISGLQQAETIHAEGELQKKIGEMNAEFAEYDAFVANAEGMSEVARYQTVVSQTMADQGAQNAARNIDDSFGTAEAIKEESKFTGLLNTMDLTNQARLNAQGYMREARMLRLGNKMTDIQTRGRETAARVQAYSSAASTMASGYGKG
jgi:cell division septum initiation protein DivIVA